jgi:hypothetical protein
MVPLLVMRLVLITIDGVRPQDLWSGVASGELPVLGSLVRRGVGLVDLAASGPAYLSLPGYREILSGRADQHCQSNECAPAQQPTLLDELPGAVFVIASWESYEHALMPGKQLVSAGRHGGGTRERLRKDHGDWLDRGAAADPWPGRWDYRPDWLTAALARAVAPQAEALVVGLGDTDEYAHRGDVARYRAALRAADATIGALLACVPGDALVLVTSDHGRAPNFRDHGSHPASAASWLIAAGGNIPSRGIVRGQEHRLRDIAPTIRVLLGLPPDGAPAAGRPIDALLPSRYATIAP